jgi:hypothetical protein
VSETGSETLRPSRIRNDAWFERVATDVAPWPQLALAAFGATQAKAAIQRIAQANRWLGRDLMQNIEFRPRSLNKKRDKQKLNRSLKGTQYIVQNVGLGLPRDRADRMNDHSRAIARTRSR